MSNRAETEYRYEKLTWPDINEAVEKGNVCILPVGAIEQHGPHLPLDMDVLAPTEIARMVGSTMPENVLVLPTVSYGYTAHVMDFPGTINISHGKRCIQANLNLPKAVQFRRGNHPGLCENGACCAVVLGAHQAWPVHSKRPADQHLGTKRAILRDHPGHRQK